MTDNGQKLNDFIFKNFNEQNLDDDDLVQNIILCFDLLNLKTISQYAKENGKTYRGVSKFNKNIVSINNNKFIIDNL
jgi:hypothetical protein